MKIYWEWKAFRDFTDPNVLYQVLQLREQVFVIEQSCIYPDIDGKDAVAQHLLGWTTDSNGDVALAAYARLFLPTQMGETLSFGRVVVSPALRGLGVGDQLLTKILDYLQASPYCDQSIVISAQCYLVRFYQKFGFQTVGEAYDEDGILHIKMVR